MTNRQRRNRRANVVACVLTISLILIAVVVNLVIVSIWFGGLVDDFSLRGAIIVSSLLFGLETALISLPMFYGFKKKVL